MATMRVPQTVRVGLLADEPMRIEGLSSIFDGPPGEGQAQLLSVVGNIAQLLAAPTLQFIIMDLNSSSGGLGTVKAIRRARPDIRLIVIGPAGDDELIMDSIIAGARAYLDLSAGPSMVRNAIEDVRSGSIWAPRRLLSRLIDRMLAVPDSSLTSAAPHLTSREREVLDLILLARSNREIAHQLGIGERTVKAHVGRLMRKNGADNRIELTLRALNRPLIPGTQMIERRRQSNFSSGGDFHRPLNLE